MNEGIVEFWQDSLDQITEKLPIIILEIAIIFGGYILARIVEKLVRRFILYINQVLNVSLQDRLLNVDLKSSAKIISKSFFWFILLLSFFICLKILKLDFLNVVFYSIVSYFPNVLVAIIIVFLGIVLGKLAGDLLKSAASRTLFANGAYIGSAARYLILFVSIVIAVGQLGIDIAFLTNLFIVILSSILLGASLAFGLGARTSVSNILGSYYVRKSYDLGDRIQFGKIEGTIVKIGDHAVTLETTDGALIVPSKEFNESIVTIIKEV